MDFTETQFHSIIKQSPIVVSVFHELLNCFKKSKEATISKRCPWIITSFLDKCLNDPKILEIAQILNLEIQSTSEFYSILDHHKNTLQKSQIHQILLFLEKPFESKDLTFDFLEISEKILKTSIATILKVLPDFNQEILSQIHMARNISCEMEEMIPYETSWCAYQDAISMPDINCLSEGHLLYMRRKMGGNPNKLFRLGEYIIRFGMRCCITPCHEIIHIIQRLANQTATIFSSEHDAYFIQGTLFWEVSKSKELDSIFVEGYREAILVSLFRSAKRVWTKVWDPNVKVIYNEWKESFGLKDLSEWNDDNGLRLEGEFGCVLGFEGFFPKGDLKYPSLEQLVDMLGVLFKNRTGDTAKTQIRVPNNIKIDINTMEKLIL